MVFMASTRLARLARDISKCSRIMIQHLTYMQAEIRERLVLFPPMVVIVSYFIPMLIVISITTVSDKERIMKYVDYRVIVDMEYW